MPMKDSIMESNIQTEIAALHREIAELKSMIASLTYVPPQPGVYERAMTRATQMPGNMVLEQNVPFGNGAFPISTVINYDPSPMKDRQT
jgi:hypothetical protein